MERASSFKKMFSFGRRKQAAAVALEAAEPEAAAGGAQRDTCDLVSFAGSTTLKVDATDPRWAGRLMPELLGAAKASDLALLTRLLDRPGVDVDERDAAAGGETALHLAAEEGHTEVVALLLARRADVNGRSREGWAPLHSAAQSEAAHSTDVVALLLLRGADPRARTRIDATPLHMAAFNGRLGATKVLIARGGDVLAVDAHGCTPLDDARHRSTSCPCTSDDRERKWGAVIAFLVRAMPMEPDARVALAHRSWRLEVAATLEEAAVQGRLPQLRRLLACYAADVDAQDHDGATALHMAAEGGHAEAAELLVRARANVGSATNTEETPLHVAAREGHAAAAKLLVARGADVQIRTKSGATPLDLATRHRSHEWEALAAFLGRASLAEGAQPKGARLLAIRELVM